MKLPNVFPFQPMQTETYFKIGKFLKWLFFFVIVVGVYSMIMISIGEKRASYPVTSVSSSERRVLVSLERDTPLFIHSGTLDHSLKSHGV